MMKVHLDEPIVVPDRRWRLPERCQADEHTWEPGQVVLPERLELRTVQKL